MNNLYTVIANALEEVVEKVYFEEAEENATFPYAVFKVPVSTKNYSRDDVILEVDIWGNGSAMTIEKLADSVAAKLNRFHYYEDGNLQTSIYQINRLRITDPDPDLTRRQLRFRCDTYF